jgi:CheY-like chemotaxis protein
MSNLVSTTIASSEEKQCRMKVDVVRNDTELVIRVLIQSLSNARPTPLLDGIGLDFSASSLLQPMAPANMYQGLVITREYLRLLGSRLDTNWSEDGGRLSFSFDIKVASTRSPKSGKVGADNQSNFGHYVRDPSSVKVLLVEDNQVNMRIAKAILRRLGFEAATAVNGLEAISMMHQSVFDIVFMVSRRGKPAVHSSRSLTIWYSYSLRRTAPHP